METQAGFERQQGPAFVYRISNVEEWKRAQEEGGLWGSQMDRDSGFVHLSSEEQVPATLKRFFVGREDIILLKIDAAKLGAQLRFEDTTGHGVFPHFYGSDGEYHALPLAAILQAEPITHEFRF
ncbi:hypothetical protein KFL_001160200 [Klebsormidium nitens]|uniref:DUF952 domain-containing protein n=1 Tax=Klebsormidium nitens TaxID=105231 RepID=A0A1Y1I1D9_KLENI|nr:hypothetical protein KFL_001160200 [Klebsormidium nitens]|eukprot:GAQ82586.1 hypothetical protein KFL_001160200 [Klebsormidium nitens]